MSIFSQKHPRRDHETQECTPVTSNKDCKLGQQYVSLPDNCHGVTGIQIHIVPRVHGQDHQKHGQVDSLTTKKAVIDKDQPSNTTGQSPTPCSYEETDKLQIDQQDLLPEEQTQVGKETERNWNIHNRLSLLWIMWIKGLGIIVGIKVLEVYLQYMKFYSWSLNCCDWVSSTYWSYL